MVPHQGSVVKMACSQSRPHFTHVTINLPTFVVFMDLVKAFDTVDHKVLMRVLERYGAPPKLKSAIARMYTDLKIVLKLGKVKAEMNQTVGVRQGDCMAPVLFLFMMMAFAETLGK